MNKVEDFIQHHGVKGMKWGVRRYQPYQKGKKGTFLGRRKNARKERSARIDAKQKGTKLGNKTDQIHSKMSKNKSYSKNYETLRKKGRTHREAVNTANQHARTIRSQEIGAQSEVASHLLTKGRGVPASKAVKALSTVAKTVAITAVAAGTIKAGEKGVDLLRDRHAGRFVRANARERAKAINKLSKTMKRVYG